MTRDPIAGPDSGPTDPFPIKVSGQIVKGFGRGSKELGIPTANIPIEGLDVGGHTDIESGVYFGWASISLASIKDKSGLKEQAANPPGAASTTDNDDGLAGHDDTNTGLISPAMAHQEQENANVYPMVMSIGWNPVYKNEKRSLEAHVIHEFDKDFYGALMNLQILGFIRPERDYDSLDALIKDIKTDIEVASKSLQRQSYESIQRDPWLRNWDWAVKPAMISS